MDNQEILDSLLNGSDLFKDNDEEILRDYISVKSIEAIELNMNFFTDIPKADTREVFGDLLSLIFKYEQELYYAYFPMNVMIRKRRKIQKETPNKQIKLFDLVSNKKKEIRPISKINQDLKLLKKYKNMLDRLFNSSQKVDKFITINVHNDIHTLYEINNKLIEDLEKKEFEIIKSDNYYDVEVPSKIEIKNFLKNIKSKYSLKNVSLDEKHLHDNILSNVNDD